MKKMDELTPEYIIERLKCKVRKNVYEDQKKKLIGSTILQLVMACAMGFAVYSLLMTLTEEKIVIQLVLVVLCSGAGLFNLWAACYFWEQKKELDEAFKIKGGDPFETTSEV